MPPPDDSQAAQPAHVEEDDSDVEVLDKGMTTPSNLCGYDAYKRLGVTRHRVKGDGSCWVYAILACLRQQPSTVLRMLEHHDEKRNLSPPTRDCDFDRVCREHALNWFDANIEWYAPQCSSPRAPDYA